MPHYHRVETVLRYRIPPQKQRLTRPLLGFLAQRPVWDLQTLSDFQILIKHLSEPAVAVSINELQIPDAMLEANAS